MSNLELTASMTAKDIQSWAMNNTDGIIEAGVGMVLHKVEGAEHKVTSAEQRASDKQDVKALLREKLVPNENDTKANQAFDAVFGEMDGEIKGKDIQRFFQHLESGKAVESGSTGKVAKTTYAANVSNSGSPLAKFQGFESFQAILGEFQTNQYRGEGTIDNFKAHASEAMAFIAEVSNSGDQGAIKALHSEFNRAGVLDQTELEKETLKAEKKLEIKRSKPLHAPTIDRILKVGGIAKPTPEDRLALMEKWEEASGQPYAMDISKNQKFLLTQDTRTKARFEKEMVELKEWSSKDGVDIFPIAKAWNDGVSQFKVKVNWNPAESTQPQAALFVLIDAIAENVNKMEMDDPARKSYAKLLSATMPMFFVKAANIKEAVNYMKTQLPNFVVDTSMEGIRQSDYRAGDLATVSKGIDPSEQKHYDACRGFSEADHNDCYFFALMQNPESDSANLNKGWEERLATAVDKL